MLTPQGDRICPVCQKRLGEAEARWCKNCKSDVTGTWIPLNPNVGTQSPAMLIDVLRPRAGHYVYTDAFTPMKPTAVLLEGVHDDYLTFSISGQVIHLPFGAIYLVIERDSQCMVLLRHEFAPPADSSAGWFVGFSVPVG